MKRYTPNRKPEVNTLNTVVSMNEKVNSKYKTGSKQTKYKTGSKHLLWTGSKHTQYKPEVNTLNIKPEVNTLNINWK